MKVQSCLKYLIHIKISFDTGLRFFTTLGPAKVHTPPSRSHMEVCRWTLVINTNHLSK